MKDEYRIINATSIQKRIEELEKEYKSEPAYQFNAYGDKLIKEIIILKEILTQSLPLIPEIESAYNIGREDGKNKSEGWTPDYKNSQDYIEKLKLDM